MVIKVKGYTRKDGVKVKGYTRNRTGSKRKSKIKKHHNKIRRNSLKESARKRIFRNNAHGKRLKDFHVET